VRCGARLIAHRYEALLRSCEYGFTGGTALCSSGPMVHNNPEWCTAAFEERSASNGPSTSTVPSSRCFSSTVYHRVSRRVTSSGPLSQGCLRSPSTKQHARQRSGTRSGPMLLPGRDSGTACVLPTCGRPAFVRCYVYREAASVASPLAGGRILALQIGQYSSDAYIFGPSNAFQHVLLDSRLPSHDRFCLPRLFRDAMSSFTAHVS
jgi:hypothetical protein